MRNFTWLIAAMIFSFVPDILPAQTRYDFIFSENSDQQDSILDFGATVPGAPLFKKVTLKNLSADTVWMAERTEDYFALRSTAPPDDRTFEEFFYHRL